MALHTSTSLTNWQQPVELLKCKEPTCTVIKPILTQLATQKYQETKKVPQPNNTVRVTVYYGMRLLPMFTMF